MFKIAIYFISQKNPRPLQLKIRGSGEEIAKIPHFFHNYTDGLWSLKNHT